MINITVGNKITNIFFKIDIPKKWEFSSDITINIKPTKKIKNLFLE